MLAEINSLLGGSSRAKSSSDPLLEALNVADLFQIALHHVGVAGLDQYLLPITHRLQ